ncbi:MAG: hypothetical protein AMXMBFR78_03000 [Rubrivivax sp.]
MIRGALSWLSPAGSAAQLSILILHRVHAEADPLFPGEATGPVFERTCRWLRDWMNVLPLDEAVTRLREQRLPARACAITFDDGYRDNHAVALPILKRLGLPATFFVATGFSDGQCMWNDQIIEAVRGTRAEGIDLPELAGSLPRRMRLTTWNERRQAIDALLAHAKYLPPGDRAHFAAACAARLGVSLPRGLMMTRDEIRDMHIAGMQVGAHTVTHPILLGLPEAQARDELSRSKSELEGAIDAPVTLFAYPNGKLGVDFDATVARWVAQAGFACAVTTEPGASRATTDPYQLPRYTPWARGRLRFGWQLAGNLQRSRRSASECGSLS